MEAACGDDERALSLAWGRAFSRVVAVKRRSNVIVELEEQGIDGPTRRFLRLARPTGWSEAEIGWELALIRSIPAGSRAAVARPLPGADGRYLRRQAWHGETRHGCLFEAAPGRDLQMREADLSSFGRALADLQAAMSGHEEAPPPGRRVDIAGSCRAARQWLTPHGVAARALAEDVETAIPLLETAFTRVALPSGACHGDAHILNAKIDGEQVTFFDFDECVMAPLALDLVAMAAWLRPEPDCGRLWDALLRGYAARRQLTPDEQAALPMLALVSELRQVHNLARFCTMPEALWGEMRERVHRRLSDFRETQRRSDPVRHLP